MIGVFHAEIIVIIVIIDIAVICPFSLIAILTKKTKSNEKGLCNSLV